MSQVEFHSCGPYPKVSLFTKGAAWPLRPPKRLSWWSMQADLSEGAALFSAGHWWEAHEAWEGPWMGAQGQERQFIQGLILLAAALHKRWHHGSVTSRNFEKALAKFSEVPPVYRGVDVAQLCGDVQRALATEGLRPQLRVSQG